MKYVLSLAVAIPVLAAIFFLGLGPSSAASPPVPADDKGKSCRMEQQCHWENFKKICVYVKVCR